MEEVFGYIFFRYICVLSIHENKLMKIFRLPGGVETYIYIVPKMGTNDSAAAMT